MDVYLEIGSRRVFAAAVDWPGWCRAGRDEAAALDALLAYRERYRAAVGGAGGRLPGAAADRPTVVERVKGGASTDFGAPGSVPGLDAGQLAPKELARQIALHRACWNAFAGRARRAAGQILAPSGPRGGGRSLAKMHDHVAEAEQAYIGGMGGRYRGTLSDGDALRDAFVATLEERNAGRLPDVGPRGGRRWPARYAVRRSCWHLLDHAWELEDRLAAAAGKDAG